MYRTKQATNEGSSDGETMIACRVFQLQPRTNAMDISLHCLSVTGSTVLTFSSIPEGFCQACHIPLAPDPKVDSLFIYLHAWRYTTEAWGEFSTPL